MIAMLAHTAMMRIVISVMRAKVATAEMTVARQMGAVVMGIGMGMRIVVGRWWMTSLLMRGGGTQDPVNIAFHALVGVGHAVDRFS